MISNIRKAAVTLMEVFNAVGTTLKLNFNVGACVFAGLSKDVSPAPVRGWTLYQAFTPPDIGGDTITSDAGLLACRELDDALSLIDSAEDFLKELF